MLRFTKLAAFALAGAFALAWWRLPDAPKVHSDGPRVLSRHTVEGGEAVLEVVSAPYRLDRVYSSMEGPHGNQAALRLSHDDSGEETLYLSGIAVQVVDAGSLAPLSNEYFCHSNLTLNTESTSPERHNRSFALPTHNDWRFFTLVPGRTTVRLPPGFGIPVKSGTPLDNFTMALNQNAGRPSQVVRMKTSIWFRRPVAGEDAVRPLFRRALYVYQQHAREEAPGPQVNAPATVAHPGEECAEHSRQNQKGERPSVFAPAAPRGLPAHPGASCCVENASGGGVVPQFGAENTIHWMVPPGRHVYRTEVTRQLALPFDTTVHYVTGHLHPFGRRLRLVNLDTGRTLFEIEGRSFGDRLGVESVSEIVNRAGEPLRRGARLELMAEYENTLDRPIDAMAILYLYALDEAPATAGAAARR